jgi:hypothetical protein
MKVESLSLAQKKVFSRMDKAVWKSAYDLGASLTTLRCLTSKGFVESKSLPGSIAFPRTSILFRIK